MRDEPTLPKYLFVRTFLRIAGPLVVAAGVYCLYQGISRFGDFGPAFYETPKYMFAGIPLLFVGIVMSVSGYAGAAARYQASQMAPVATDVINYVGEGTRDGVKAVASAIAEGISEGVAGGHAHVAGEGEAGVVHCPKCNTPNAAGANFCTQCGQALPRPCECSACGKTNEAGAKFCNGCGNRLR